MQRWYINIILLICQAWMWLFTMYIFFKLCLFVLLTLFPSLILFTFARSPSLSKSRSSGLGECLFFLRWPSYSCCFLLLALCSASPGLSKKSDNRCSCRWLYVCLQESMVSQSFSDHFSWKQLLSTLDFFLLSFFISACDFLSWRPYLGTLVCAFTNVTPNVFLNGPLIFS